MDPNVLKNEKGVALVVSLILLIVLTLIGFSSINTTTFEAHISGNERLGIDAFNASEAGNQMALSQVPDTSPIPVSQIGEDSYSWSGGPQDKAAPAPIVSFGLHGKPGYEASWAFRRYQANTTGESAGATKEIESQFSYGPFFKDTSYNN